MDLCNGMVTVFAPLWTQNEWLRKGISAAVEGGPLFNFLLLGAASIGASFLLAGPGPGPVVTFTFNPWTSTRK